MGSEMNEMELESSDQNFATAKQNISSPQPRRMTSQSRGNEEIANFNPEKAILSSIEKNFGSEVHSHKHSDKQIALQNKSLAGLATASIGPNTNNPAQTHHTPNKGDPNMQFGPGWTRTINNEECISTLTPNPNKKKNTATYTDDESDIYTDIEEVRVKVDAKKRKTTNKTPSIS